MSTNRYIIDEDHKYHASRGIKFNHHVQAYRRVYDTREEAEYHLQIYRLPPEALYEAPAPICMIWDHYNGTLPSIPQLRNLSFEYAKAMHLHEGRIRFVCTKDPDRYRIISMKPGRFLKQRGIDLTDKQVSYLAEYISKGEPPAIDENLRFELRDDISWVYMNSVSSCMSGNEFIYAEEHHPAEVYENSDWKIAVLINEEGKIVARSLVVPERKIFLRIYPTEGAAHEDGFLSEDHLRATRARLQSELENLGFENKYSLPRSRLDGVRLNWLPIHRGLLMPYLDHDLKVEIDWEEQTVVLHSHGYDAQSTTGCYNHSWPTCQVCATRSHLVREYNALTICDEHVTTIEGQRYICLEAA